jgi:hypothetical protein
LPCLPCLALPRLACSASSARTSPQGREIFLPSRVSILARSLMPRLRQPGRTLLSGKEKGNLFDTVHYFTTVTFKSSRVVSCRVEAPPPPSPPILPFHHYVEVLSSWSAGSRLDEKSIYSNCTAYFPF